MKNNKKVIKETKEGVDLDKKQIIKIKKLFDSVETKIAKIKSLVFTSGDEYKKAFQIDTKNAKDYVEGVFDGRFMFDENGKKYPVPENYASKSKLVVGDNLKLVIASDGTYVYKQISPIERKKVTGILIEKNDGYQVKTDKKTYNVLKASVTYFKVKEGNRLTIIIPEKQDVKWAAIENKIIKDS